MKCCCIAKNYGTNLNVVLSICSGNRFAKLCLNNMSKKRGIPMAISLPQNYPYLD